MDPGCSNRGLMRGSKGKSLGVSGEEIRTLNMGAGQNHWYDGFLCMANIRDEQMSVEDSHFTYSSGMLPSLGARSNRRVKLGRFVISPYDTRYRAWETFLIVLVIYSAWVSPFEFAFINAPSRSLLVADLLVDGFFLTDIIMTFFVAFLDKRTYLLEDDHKDIAKRYICTWFLFDVSSTIPFEAISFISNLRKNLSFGVLNMLRLWRLRRVSALFARLLCLQCTVPGALITFWQLGILMGGRLGLVL